MTYAPSRLTELAAYWVAQGGVHLGIVGNLVHCTGYHLGRDRIYGSCACKPKGTCEPGSGNQDYSVQHPRDKAGLTNAASAIDLGRLDGTLAGLQSFSRWLVAQCMADRAAYRDVREVIYSPDGVKVQRYSGIDNLIHTGQGNGDNSHLTHTHISFFRDSENRDKRPLFAPYFAPSPPDTGVAMPTLVNAVPVFGDVPEKTQLYRQDGSPLVEATNAQRSKFALPVDVAGKPFTALWPVTTGGVAQVVLVERDAVTNQRPIDVPPPPDTTPYDKAAVDGAYNAGLDAAGKAVAAVPRR